MSFEKDVAALIADIKASSLYADGEWRLSSMFPAKQDTPSPKDSGLRFTMGFEQNGWHADFLDKKPGLLGRLLWRLLSVRVQDRGKSCD